MSQKKRYGEPGPLIHLDNRRSVKVNVFFFFFFLITLMMSIDLKYMALTGHVDNVFIKNVLSYSRG